MVSYKNSFYDIRNTGSQRVITTDAKPVHYKGYDIYHRIKSSSPGGHCFDIVKDGVCIGMMAGLQGCKKRIDENDFERVKEKTSGQQKLNLTA